MVLERIQFYSRHIKILEEIMVGAAAEETDFELLQTLPGVAKILASIIMHETGVQPVSHCQTILLICPRGS
jgi:hypothetical protein